MPLSKRKQAIKKHYGEDPNVSPIKKAIECTKIIKRKYEEGEITEFVINDLLRFYEVVDEIYDEYLENTKDIGPADN